MTESVVDSLPAVWTWVRDNGAGLQAVAGLLSLGAIVVAAKQVSEASAQRDVANSFEVAERFNRLLGEWSQSGSEHKDRKLGDLLGATEVAAAAINYRRFSKVARYFVRHLIKDALCLIADDEDSLVRTRNLMTDLEVCRQVRLFLALNFKLMKRLPSCSKIYSAFFAGESVLFVWDDNFAGWLARRWYIRRARWGHV